MGQLGGLWMLFGYHPIWTLRCWTPCYCCCGFCASARSECRAIRSPTKTHRNQFIAGLILLAIATPISIYFMMRSGDDDSYAQQLFNGYGGDLLLAHVCAFTLGFGVPLTLWGLIALCGEAIRRNYGRRVRRRLVQQHRVIRHEESVVDAQSAQIEI